LDAPDRARQGRRRPAAREEGRTLWEQGLETELHQVPIDLFKPGSSLVITVADYFGGAAKIAGTIQRLEVEKDSSYLQVRLSGTDHEGVLRAHSGMKDQPFRVHICPPQCGRQESGDFLAHGLKGRRRKEEGEEGWVTSLEPPAMEGEDELAMLRRREQELLRERGERARASPSRRERRQTPKEPEEEEIQKKKKKKKKKKAKEDAEELVNGRHAARASVKELSQVFGGTALDPREKIRKRVLRRAQKYAARKKSRRSSSSSSHGSSGSSTSTSSGEPATEGVFSEETKARGLSESFPAALSVETLLSMRRSLLATSGEDGDLQSTKPVALLYYRNVLGRKATGAQARELLTLSSAVDALLRGRVALATDILCQRLKAQESVLAGTPWQVAQKVKIASAEATALIARGELQAAQRESYLDSKTKWQNLASTPKGQPKGKGKGKSDKDGGKDERREESRKDRGKGGEKK